MSVRMQINGSEAGIVRLFHIDLPKEAVPRFTEQAGTGEWPLKYALGAKSLRPSFVEVVAVDDLGEMSLSQYLVEAYDAAGEDFDAMRARIDSLKGHVVILPSQAFDRVTQDLAVSAPLRWIGSFSEAGAAQRAVPLQSRAAEGMVVGRAPRAQTGAPMRIRVILSVLALLLLGAVLWIALA